MIQYNMGCISAMGNFLVIYSNIYAMGLKWFFLRNVYGRSSRMKQIFTNLRLGTQTYFTNSIFIRLLKLKGLTEFDAMKIQGRHDFALGTRGLC